LTIHRRRGADDALPGGPGRFAQARADVAVAEQFHIAERVADAVHRNQSAAGPHKGIHGAFGSSAPAGPVVIDHQGLIRRKSFRGEARRLFGHARIKPAGGVERPPQTGRGGAPVVIVAAGNEEHPDAIRPKETLRRDGRSRKRSTGGQQGKRG
jgi:hypothetical protein